MPLSASANDIFAEPVKLLVGILQAAPVAQTEDHDGIAAILAVQLIDVRRLKQAVGLMER